MQPEIREIESLLSRPEPALDDEGFTQRVMAQIPASRIDPHRKRRWTLVVGAALGAILTASFAGGMQGIPAIAGTLLIALVAMPSAWALRTH